MSDPGRNLTPRPVCAANRFGVDYRAEAARMGPPVVPIIDIHSHIFGLKAPVVYHDVRKAFGIARTYTMTQIAHAHSTRDLMGELAGQDTLRFIAFPSFSQPDRARAFGADYPTTIERFRKELDARMLKLWASPRLRELLPDFVHIPYGATHIAEIDSPERIKACEVGTSLGMMIMIHIADPDTWYQAKYSDPVRFGSKRAEYERLERMLDRFTVPWIAAHMGGWPEDLKFLDGLLARHPNLHLDTSATKWVVRALGLQPRENTRAFFTKWSGRLFFGSDIVANDDHFSASKTTQSSMADLASSPEEAFDLYASRYWALRTMFETTYDGESNIADPDLMMLDPANHTPMSAPRLGGIGLDEQHLSVLYRGAAESVVEAWWARP